jgi:hypothetical protein
VVKISGKPGRLHFENLHFAEPVRDNVQAVAILHMPQQFRSAFAEMRLPGRHVEKLIGEPICEIRPGGDPARLKCLPEPNRAQLFLRNSPFAVKRQASSLWR